MSNQLISTRHESPTVVYPIEWMDELESTLQFKATMDAFISHHQPSSPSLGYNSFFKRSGSPLSPAKWRMQICRLTQRLLSEEGVPVQYILSELQKYLSTERYGFNGDIIMTLAQHDAPINAQITFRGTKCTLFHGIAALSASCPLTSSSERFHRYLVRNRPILDIEDEHGRTALAIAVWSACSSSSRPNVKEIHFMRCCIEYGFSPFVQYRGISIMEKLNRIYKQYHQQQAKGGSSSLYQSNDAQYFADFFTNIPHNLLRIETIHSSLKDLINKQVIVHDVANVIMDCVGICHFQQNVTVQPIPRRVTRSNSLSKDKVFTDFTNETS